MSRNYFWPLMLVGCLPLLAQIANPPTIANKEARSHLLHGVDPLYPAIAKMVHVRDEVVLHVNVNSEGHVTKITVVSGPAMLVTSAVEAVRGWEFAPFQIEGNNAAVTLELRLLFPTLEPRPESKVDAKIFEIFVSKRESCLSAERKQAWTKAIELCNDIVGTAASFPEESVRNREIQQAHEAYGRALAESGRYSEALDQFQISNELARKYSYPWEPRYANAFYLSAAAETNMGKKDAADANYLIAEKSYREAFVKFPNAKEQNELKLAEVLARHALLADKLGNLSAAKDMREEAKKLDRKVALEDIPAFPRAFQE